LATSPAGGASSDNGSNLGLTPLVEARSRRSKRVTLPGGYSVTLPAPPNPSIKNPFGILAAMGPITPGGGRNIPEFIENDFLKKFPDEAY
jgi:hypothetical protein